MLQTLPDEVLRLASSFMRRAWRVTLLLCACAASPAPEDWLTFDPCQPLPVVLAPGTRSDERARAMAGLELWNEVLHPSLRVGDQASGPHLLLRFEDVAAAGFGHYDVITGEVLINARMDPAAQVITVAHELGHAFGLRHVDARPSVMNSGNLDVMPTQEDAAAVTALWGTCVWPSSGR